MYILCIGDPHFRVDNVDETLHFINSLESYISNNPYIDIIIVLGDILHTHEKIHTVPLNNAVKFFKMLTSFSKIKTFTLVGNHDATSNTIFLTDNHWMNFLKDWGNITVVDTPIKYHINSEDFITLCPYVPDGRFVEALNRIPDWKESSVVFGHQLLDGAKMGMIVANGVEKWLDEYPLLISGHIHDAQEVQKNYINVGSSLQHSYAENGSKRLLMLNVNEEVKMEDVYLDIKRKKIIYATINELEDISNKIKENTDNIEYIISLKGSADDFKTLKKTDKYKDILNMENIKNIKFKSERVTSNEKDFISDDFSEHLNYSIYSSNDPYLISLYEHILLGKEDLSMEDIIEI